MPTPPPRPSPAAYRSADFIQWTDVAREAATGKAYLHTLPDVSGRPVIVVRAAKHVTGGWGGVGGAGLDERRQRDGSHFARQTNAPPCTHTYTHGMLQLEPCPWPSALRPLFVAHLSHHFVIPPSLPHLHPHPPRTHRRLQQPVGQPAAVRAPHGHRHGAPGGGGGRVHGADGAGHL